MSACTPNLTVRAATPSDVPLILQLILELAEYERGRELVVATEASLHQHLFGSGFGRGRVVDALIGEIDGAPQGFALYFSNFSTWLGVSGLYLEDLFVRPDARGSGLGRALLARLAQISLERGGGRVEWAVLNWNTPAIGFYERLGATPLDEWTTYRLSGEALKRLARGE